MKTHELKILPEYFEAVKDGRKKFELRKNDRNFEVNDILVLKEYMMKGYTGREVKAKITYVLKNVPIYGLDDEYAILSIDLL